MVPERDTSSHNVGGNTPIYAPYNHRRIRMTYPAKTIPAAVVYGQRHGTTKERFDRRQPPRFKYWGSNGSNRLLQQANLRPPEMKYFVGRKAAGRGEIQSTDDIAGTSRRVYGPEKRTGSNPRERSLGMREISGQSAVSPVMRVRVQSRDIPGSRAKCADVEKAVADVFSALLASSTASVTYCGGRSTICGRASDGRGM